MGDGLKIVANRSLAPGPIVAEVIRGDGTAGQTPGPVAMEIGYLFNGTVTATTATTWTVTPLAGGAPVIFDITASATDAGLGLPPDNPVITVEFGVSGGAPLFVNERWSVMPQLATPDRWQGIVNDLPAVTTPQGAWIYLRATDAVGTTSTVVFPTTLLPGPAAPPTAPANLAGSIISATRVDLTWTDASNNELAFRLERSTDNFATRSEVLLPANITSYSDTTVVLGNTYSYRVVATNGAGNSATSNAVTLHISVPDAPPSLRATVTAPNSVTLDWTDNADNESASRIERATVADGTPGPFTGVGIGSVAAGVTSFFDGTVQLNNTYAYRVFAFNPIGDSAPSNQAQARVAAPDPPASLLGTVVPPSRVDLTWSDLSDNETGFRIERSYDGTTLAEINEVGANVTSFSDNTPKLINTVSYRVQAFNGVGTSASSNVLGPLNLLIPSAPSSLTADMVGPAEVALSWTDNANNETGCRIERSADGVTFAALNTVNPGITAFSDSTVDPVVGTYYYRVFAFNDPPGGDSTSSNVVTVVLRPPTAPSSLTAVAASDLQVNLTWVHDDTVETGFRIERATSATFTAPTVVGTVAANIGAFSDTTVQPSTQYFYRVFAVNSIGDSPASNTASVTTPPARPSNLTAARVEPTRIEMTWVDNSVNETVFRIQRATDDAFTQGLFESAVGANRTTFRDETFTAAVNFYRVLASNANGSSGPSNVIRVATTNPAAPGPSPPAAPTNLSATAIGPDPANLRVDLQWRDNSNNETGFRIQRSLDNTFATVTESTVAANVTTSSDTTVVLGTTYFYRAVAFNDVGVSLPSNVRQVRVRLTGSFLSNPVVGPTQVDLRWTDNTIDETGFRVERSLDGANFQTINNVASADTPGTVAEITFSDTGVTPATTFFYRVTPFNAAGDLQASNVREATTLAVAGSPVAPSNLSLTVLSETRVDLEWRDNSADETGFRIERSLDNTFASATKFTVGANVTTFSDTSAPVATTLSYRVVALNAAGSSLPSNVMEVTTSAVNGAPAAPSNLSATAIGPNQVDLTWGDNSNDETGFRIQRSLTASFSTSGTFSVNAGATSFSDVTAAPSTTYFYRVNAVSAAGDSLPSNARLVVTPDPTAAPVAPSNLTAMAVSASGVDLTWADISNSASGFRIERSTNGTTFTTLGTTAANVTTFSDVSVTAGSTFFYRVIGVNVIGNSPTSNVAQAALVVPQAPADLRAAVTGPTTVHLTWQDMSSNETGFRIERSTGAAFTVIGTRPAGATSFDDTNATAGATFSYRVVATNIVGASAQNPTVSVPIPTPQTGGQQQPQPQAAATPMPPSIVIPDDKVVLVPKREGETATIVQPTKEVTMELDDKTTITVPPQALSATAQMKARKVEEKDLPKPITKGKVRKAMEIDLFDDKGAKVALPEIRLPITIEVPLTADDLAAIGGDPNNVELRRYDEGTGAWVKLATQADLPNKMIRAQLRHLSLFAVVVPAPVTQAQPTPTAAPPVAGGTVPGASAWLVIVLVGLGILLFGFRLLRSARKP
ncbi:MAG: fibronectin type III domain-containing protein [Chloroflexi bacterium]|nr:fibronectin type III domain-containing protein [Chloroflexota bacterium]